MRRAAVALVCLAIVLSVFVAGVDARRRKTGKKGEKDEEAPAANAPTTGAKCPKKNLNNDKYNDLGLELYRNGKPQEAIACFEDAIKLGSKTRAWYYIGMVREGMRDMMGALEYYKQAVQNYPEHEAFASYGQMLVEKREFQEAARYVRKALKEKETGIYHYVLGKALEGMGDMRTAVVHAIKSTEVLPHPEARTLSVFATFAGYLAFRIPEYLDRAIDMYKLAVDLEPTSAPAWFNLGTTYTEYTANRRWASLRNMDINQIDYTDESLVCYRKALDFDPGHLQAAVSIYHSSNYNAEWRNRTANWDMVHKLMERQLRDNEPATITAEMALVAFNENLLLRINRQMAGLWEKNVDPTLASNLKLRWPSKAIGSGKMRIGYFSTFGGSSIMSYLTDCIYSYHDQSKFEVILIDLGRTPNEGGVEIEGVNRVLNVGTLNAADAARAISDLQLHVLLDFNGLKVEHAFTALLYRPTPVQIGYLGWPCSCGSNALQYMIVDDVVSPLSYHTETNPKRNVLGRYHESLIYLPSYFVSCHHRSFAIDFASHTKEWVDNERETRLGVKPDSGAFVFSSFNQMYKLSPELADSWARIMTAVPNSVLWLLRHPMAGEKRVRREMIARGIENSRIIFTDPLLLKDYIGLSDIADVFLDAFVYNAGATAVDMMYAGVPLITMPGDRVVARMAASIVTAANASELITSTPAEYEAMAIGLAKDPARLAALRAKLAANRGKSRLFDAQEWVSSVERAATKAWERHMAGLPPTHMRANADGAEVLRL